MALKSHVRLVKPETDAALVDYLVNRRLFGVLPRDALVLLAGQARTRALDQLSREGAIAVSRRRVDILKPDQLRRVIES